MSSWLWKGGENNPIDDRVLETHIFLVRHRLLILRRVFVLRPRSELFLSSCFSSFSVLSHSFSTIFFLLFLFSSGRSRTSRLSLLHLFIGSLYYLQFGARSREGNFILVFCPVSLRSLSRCFFISSILLALLPLHLLLLLYKFLSGERAWLRSYSIVMRVRNIIRRREEMAID